MMRKIFKVGFVLTAVILGGISPALAVNSPNAPANISVTSSSSANAATDAGNLTVSWQKPVDDSTHPVPIAYIATATSGSQSVSVTVPLVTISTTNYSAVLSGLIGGTPYSVTVTSKSSENQFATSAAFPATPITSPGLPIVVSATPSPASVELQWGAPLSNGGSSITSYEIKDGAGTVTTISNVSTSTKTFSGLSAGSVAKYSIRSINANGHSDWAAFADATLPSAPGAPTNVTAVSGENTITVSWVAPTNNGNSAITGYKIYLYTSAGVAVGSAVLSTTTTKELTNVGAGTYFVKVLASNRVNDSQLSSASSPVTIAAPTSLLANTPIFTPTTLPNLVIGATQNVSAVAPSTEAVAITATATPIGACTYSNGVITAVSEGTCSIRATSPATSTYADGVATKTFTITKTLQTITFAAISNQPLPGPLTVSASTSASGLSVIFSASGNCTVSGNSVSFTSVGSCVVIASQAGNTRYAAATSVTRTFSITAAPSTPAPSNNNSSNGGGSSGGGFVPGPTPTIAPTPVPLVTTKPTPAATAAPTPIESPIAIASPTASPTPKPTSSSTGVKVIGNNLLITPIGGKPSGAVTTTTLASGITNVSVRSSSNLQPVLPLVKKGEKVSVVIKDSKGKSYTVVSIVVSKTGSLKLPAIKFALKGKYTVTIKAGSKTKVINVTSQ